MEFLRFSIDAPRSSYGKRVGFFPFDKIELKIIQLKTKYLGIKAGSIARKLLKERGLQINDIKIFAAPASGPKWLVLYELDRYLMSKFDDSLEGKRHFVGSSAGAWRATAYCMKDSEDALQRLHEAYIHQAYSENPYGKEVTAGVKVVVKELLADKGQNLLVESPKKLLNIHCRGLRKN